MLRASGAPATLILSGLLAPLGAQPAPAQAMPQKQYAVAAVADSIAMAGDSAAALAMLKAAVRKNPNDAAAWHRLGMIAWRIVQPRRDGAFMRDIKDIRMNELADSALRWAAIRDPANPRYEIDLGRYIISSNLATLRFSALGHFEKALAAARKGGNSYMIAEAADEVGMVFWRRYENFADRRLTAPGYPAMTMDVFDEMMREPAKMRSLMEDLSRPLENWMGQDDYYKANDYFAEALKAEPAHLRAQRHVYMALAERKRWEELRTASSAHIRRAPWDPWAWMANGLASHRLGLETDAAVAFDSALVYLDDRDRARLTSLSRILRTEAAPKKDTARAKDRAAPKVDNSRDALRARSESAGYARRTPEEREHFERMYWMLTDPLTLTAENEHYLEFLSRVSYAEMRWTSDDFELRGADTDRGDVHIRYGPPPVVMNFSSDPSSQGMGLAGANVVWWYSQNLFFVFRQPPSYGLAAFAGDYAERARELRTAAPVLWSNVKSIRHVDSIGVQVVRFRATPNDSLADVLFVAQLPVDSLVAGTSTRNAYLDTDFRVYGGDADIYTRDSTRTPFTMSDSARAPEIPGVRSWRDRYPTGGEYVYRVEALQPQTMRGARAINRIVLKREPGYGMSDVLLAHRVLPKEGDAQRWSDFNVVPSAGRFARGQEVGLLWETYDLGQKDASSRYKVSVTLEQMRRQGALGLAMQVMSGAGQVVGRKASGSGKVSLTYERQVPPRPAVVDYLTLDLGSAPPGRYRLTVEITDQATQKTTS
ncbi:MAG TPA: GWxTD domain-containing protein, partial [Gemmatimonadaceae bacterium]|nr:GWxTD domain-containing protein [Gemmatimonadaceae bacterium]